MKLSCSHLHTPGCAFLVSIAFLWIHRLLVCDSGTELKTLPSERII